MRYVPATFLNLTLLTLVLFAARLLPVGQASTLAQEPELVLGAYPPPGDGALVNLSTRGRLDADDAAMTSNFVVRDAPVRVILRAIGPDLQRRGIADTLEDPMLRLYQDDTEILQNDDWADAETADALVASGLGPADSREAAILTTLEPGSYSSRLEDMLGGTGVGMLEIFKVGGAGELAGFATRAQVGVDDGVMVGGLILSGDLTTVLIRAIGPDLADRGVPGALQDPVLQLFRGARIIAQNDDWGDSPQADFLREQGLAPANPRESAIVATLNPGAYGGYTAVVHGAGGVSGIGLIEVNKLSNEVRPVPTAIRPPRRGAK